MMQTVEAIIDENGKVRLLEDIRLPEARRALLTILEDVPQKVSDSSNQTLAEKWSSSQDLLQAINAAYDDEDDADEKELRQFMRIKQAEVLDEWK